MSKHRPDETYCHCKTCVPVADVQKESFEVFNLDDGDKIQKKITPWKDMLENDDLQQQERKPANPDLILVASLVDRAPNLVRSQYFLNKNSFPAFYYRAFHGFWQDTFPDGDSSQF
jgi:hypothetical protein